MLVRCPVRKRAEHTSAQGSAASASPGCHVPVGSPGRGIAAEEWVPLERRKLCAVERPLPKLDVVSDGLDQLVEGVELDVGPQKGANHQPHLGPVKVAAAKVVAQVRLHCPLLHVCVGRVPSHREHGLVHGLRLLGQRRVADGSPADVHALGARVETRLERRRVEVRRRPAQLLGAALEALDDLARQAVRANRVDDALHGGPAHRRC
mmetsp:Transcript_41943/g.139060  ORF Transcript_41943/g.139060 Transcript_41943/m.139060 type:complete len:207 (-) Transcript_41943:77-697(-)|eukprot:CAMPEP_0196675030 /NCGR_PEP_ID=MMETSP1090-20130531/3809_1 /TAXON_ID=37098 /ORGANISM="Isochrysis sp, Strain CCMP1244" /LENGTH=206 /DNA_ID=CAMNT_0042012837 /DNA_START=164 /DNA_END=784 /DNA_ORIENTATION=+